MIIVSYSIIVIKESWGLNDPCEYGANIRQICRITGVSYGVIYRAKVNH